MTTAAVKRYRWGLKTRVCSKWKVLCDFLSGMPSFVDAKVGQIVLSNNEFLTGSVGSPSLACSCLATLKSILKIMCGGFVNSTPLMISSFCLCLSSEIRPINCVLSKSVNASWLHPQPSRRGCEKHKAVNTGVAVFILLWFISINE